MKKGFLIIDGAMNTYVFDKDEFNELLGYKAIDVSQVKQHKTLRELDAEVRKYLKGGE